MYVIRFVKDTKVRYATETQGNPEYNAIDTAPITGAKTWKTKRGADNYLKSRVLIGRSGQRIQKRWNEIEVIEIEMRDLNPQVIKKALTAEEEEIEHRKKLLLAEVEALQQYLQIIAAKILTSRSF